MQGIIQPEQQLVKNALKDITKILQDQIVAKFVLHQNGLMQEQQAATTVLRDINAPETVQKLNAMPERMQGQDQVLAQIVHQANGQAVAPAPVQKNVQPDIYARETVHYHNALQELMPLQAPAPAINATTGFSRVS